MEGGRKERDDNVVCLLPGMSLSQLTHLAELSQAKRAVKVSRRDLAHTLSQVCCLVA